MSNSYQSISPPDTSITDEPDQRIRRHSNIYNSFQDIFSAGGKNSINNFASSYSRSANFINADFDVSSQPNRPKTLSYGAYQHEESPLLGTSPFTNAQYSENALVEETSADAESDTVSIRSLVLRNSGNSTAPQTIFNGINTLIGIGILSLPLGLHYSGWILGSLTLLCCALSTQWTAKLLAKCMLNNDDLRTYGDLAYHTYGRVAHFVVVSTFTIDLLSAGISMIIIFADSFNAITGIEKVFFKILISILFFLSSFVRLDVLSNLSFVGIICTSMIVVIVFSCGFMKKEAPGSLIDISPTSLWPSDLTRFFLSVGIFMSPFGGHAIFPELYRDMKHPAKYNRACTTIFGFTFTVDYIMASLGYLMFGAQISDQVTKSIMTNKGFSQWVQVLICVFMGVLPISKGPLITRPIITMVDQITLDRFHQNGKESKNHSTEFVIKFINRFAVVFLFFITSLIFTDFGKIMSFLGSAICFAICVIYPLSFYFKLFSSQMNTLTKAVYLLSILTAIVFAAGGTIAVIVS